MYIAPWNSRRRKCCRRSCITSVIILFKTHYTKHRILFFRDVKKLIFFVRGKAGHRFVLHRILPTAARRRFLFREIRCPRAFLSKAQLYELKKVKVLCDAKRRRVSVSVDRQRNEFLTRHLHITTRYDALRRHRLAYFQSHQSSLHRRSTFENIGENCHVKINFTYKILCVRAHK